MTLFTAWHAPTKPSKSILDKTITAGLIDPHLHMWLFALLSNAKFITPADWNLPWGDIKGVIGHELYFNTRALEVMGHEEFDWLGKGPRLGKRRIHGCPKLF